MECSIEIYLLIAKKKGSILTMYKGVCIVYNNGEKSDSVGFTNSAYIGVSNDSKTRSK